MSAEKQQASRRRKQGSSSPSPPPQEKQQHRFGPIPSVEGWFVFITGLHDDTTEEDILDSLSQVAHVKQVRMNYDRQNAKTKGYAMVEFEDQMAAQDAINRKHGSQIKGKTISVHWAFVRGT